ncbi:MULTISPECIES: penicillin-binding protein activator [unclassified Gilliamella]|uniref:penicillin-binding protein activator n=1 Tax=unclassified Gilliamella TaxID=2685620 RepID=UPI00080EBF48|nr:penicillin-binding protein activator [Gilliamella apicola]
MNLKCSIYAMLILALFTLLVGCTGTFSNKFSDFDDSKDSKYYLLQVESSSGTAKINWQLLAIRALIKENKLSQANTLLSKLPSDLNVEQLNEKLLSQGELAIKKGKSFRINQLSIEDLNPSQLYRYYTIKLSIDNKNENLNAQSHDYVELEKYASKNQKKQILNSTWDFFSKLQAQQIHQITILESETTLQGWIELSYVYQNNSKISQVQEDDTAETMEAKFQQQKDSLKRAIQDWAIRYSDHPAKGILPVLTGEQTLSVDVNAKKVALLLPLKGSSSIFGEIIRQGYLDAIKIYPKEPQQNVIVLDTTSASIDALIQQAQEQNVELIVGPLLKSDVTKIKQLALSTPILALNKVDKSTSNSNKICYFALSPEDEARDAANHIYAQNKLRPLLLVPQSELGQRVAQSFAEQWSQVSANSSQTYVQYFGNAKALSADMNHNIGIKLLGNPIILNETSVVPEGESDEFDAVYIYSSYDELMLIKPMLDMGANKPIGNSSSSEIALYSSSKSHVANASDDFYYDMNQTDYAEIPLIINQLNFPIDIPDNIQKDYSLMRFYAMGVDAWRLANRFNQLDSYEPNFLDGLTGKLSTNNLCEVTRALSWQQYTYGSAKSNSKNE